MSNPVDARNDLRIRFVSFEDVRPLRREVLRVDMPDATVAFDGDDRPDTFHLAAIDTLGTIVAVSSWMSHPLVEDPVAPSIQLRGMATKTTHQNLGIGARLLEAGAEHARSTSKHWIWANARDVALNFYRRHGFEVIGDGFIESVTGLPHHRVRLRL